MCWQTLRGGSIEIINEPVIDFGSGGVNGPERGGSTGPLINFGSGGVKEIKDKDKATLK